LQNYIVANHWIMTDWFKKISDFVLIFNFQKRVL